jgi:hypothetical protein
MSFGDMANEYLYGAVVLGCSKRMKEKVNGERGGW